jgi:hypothetical protein
MGGAGGKSRKPKIELKKNAGAAFMNTVER